ncbi:MAG: ankyrin repeat domain-containing protein [Terracidiphilus sp.]|nr:ankyrin repeat domain-containing protein [Terracidiphilus sp.]
MPCAQIAAANNNVPLLEYLIEADVDVNAREAIGVGGFTPLHYAVDRGCFEVRVYGVSCVVPV